MRVPSRSRARLRRDHRGAVLHIYRLASSLRVANVPESRRFVSVQSMRPTAGAAPRPRRGRRRTCHTPTRRHECSAVRRATAVSAHASLVAKAKTTRGAGASRRNGSSVPRFIAQVSHPLFSWVHCTSVPPAFRREKRLALSASRPHRAQHVNGGPRKVPCGRALGRGLSVPRRARMSVPRRAQTAPTPPPPPRLLLPTAPAREHARVVPRRLCQQLQPRDQHCGVRARPPQFRAPRARRRAAAPPPPRGLRGHAASLTLY